MDRAVSTSEIRPARLARFWRDETGATAIEYAVIAGFLSIAITVAVSDLGGTVADMFTSVEESFE